MELERLVAELLAVVGPLPEAIATKEKGVYILLLDKAGFEMLDVEPGLHGVAYAGVADGNRGLNKRFREEWRATYSGRSSPRRTIGVRLWEKLELVPRPRPTRDAKPNPKQFAFEEDGEDSLRRWIRSHGRFAFRVVTTKELGGERLDHLEERLIRYLRPPINIDKWENPLGPELCRLRGKAAEAAESWLVSHQTDTL